MSAPVIYPTDEQSDRIIAALNDETFDRDVAKFVRGLRGDRENPVTHRQIKAHFSEYDKHAVNQSLTRLVAEGRISIWPASLSSSRRWNGTYVFTFNHATETA